jgi:hypothetical protein
MVSNKIKSKALVAVISVVLCSALTESAIGQAVGDYRSAGSGMWTTLGTWQRWNGAAWATPTAGQGYPGQNAAGAAVLIRNTHTVTLNGSPANAIGSLTVGEGASGIFQMGSNNTARTLNVNGDITVATGGSVVVGNNNATHNLNFGGNLTVNGSFDLNLDANSRSNATMNGTGTQTISGTGATIDFYSLTISAGTTKTLSCDITINANLSVNAGTFDLGVYTANRVTAGGTLALAAGTALRVGGANSMPANFGAYTLNATSTVEFYGSTQTVDALTYGNLTLSGSGPKSTASGATTTTVAGIFALASGITYEQAAGATSTLTLNGTTNSNAGTLGSTANPFNTINVGAGALLTNNNTVNVSTALNGTGTLTQGTNATLRIGGTSGISTLTATATGNTVEYNGGAQSINPTATYYNLTLSGTNTKTLSAVATAITGNWTNNGATLNAGTGTVTFNGSSAQTIGGTSATVFYNLTINNANGVSLIAPSSVSGTLTLTSGLLTTSGTTLMTIANTAVGSIAGASASSFINGPLARTMAADIVADGTTYSFPVGENGNYRPLGLVNVRTGATTPVLQVTISGTGASTCDETTITNISPRNWYVQAVSGNFDSAFVRINESGLTSTNAVGKATSQSGNYVSVGGSNIGASITSVLRVASMPSYFAIGTSITTTFYSYQSGDWDAATSWTTDASGTLWINPYARIPGILDNATILNGRTISVNANGKQVITLKMNSGGILDIKSTTGHNFGTVTGQGKLMLSSNTFPGGTYTSFVASGGGTVEYYNLNAVGISTAQLTYNNLTISNYTANAYNTYFDNNTNPTMYVINGNLGVKNYSSGSETVYFGNPAASDNLITMTVYGNFSVDAGCNIRVNNFASAHAIPNPTDNTTAYPVHALSLYGNLTNNGSVRFTGLPSPINNAYYTLATTRYPAATGPYYGDVQVFFYGATNNTVTCNGTTDFFRLIVAKGTDKTYTLEVSSSDTNNFALYAPNNQGNNTFDGGPEGFGYGAYYKSLFIQYGTLKLNDNIKIPSLTEGGQDFNLIPTAGLWINGANVSTTVTGVNGTGYQAVTLYGTLRISAGQFSTGDAAGMVLGTLGTPIIRIEGTGTLDVSQAWTATGGTNEMSYIQTGGTANFRLQGENHAGPMLNLSTTNSVFVMSGGSINFTNNTFADATTNYQLLDLESQVGNYQVTGGTINFNLPSSATAYTANATVPLYNLNISRRTGGTTVTIQWNTPGTALNVLGNLTIGANSALDLATSAIDLAVGGDFTIASGGTYSPATGAASTTTFNGSGNQAFNNAGTITGGQLRNLSITNASVTSMMNADVTVNGALIIDQNATLNDGGRTVLVNGNITNSGMHTGQSAAGGISLYGTAAQSISGDGTGIFKNLILNKTGGTVTASADMKVTGNLRLAGATAGAWNILNIGANRLALDTNAMVYSDMGTGTAFNNIRMIQTNGLLSAGGVSKVYSNTSAFLFPFGFGAYYLPASIQFTAAPDTFGTVTSRPVNARHPLAQGTNNALTCYWKTSGSGFVGIPAGSVKHIYYYNDAFVPVVNDDANYIPGYYNGASWTSINNTNLVDETSNIDTISTANSANGEFTAGRLAAFGSIPALYSVADGDWSTATTWSTTRGGTPGDDGTPTPGTLVHVCNGYTVTTSTPASSSSLIIEPGSILDLQNVNGHNFGTIINNDTTGSGTLRIGSSAYFPTGDWGDFLGSTGGTVEYYTYNGAVTIPITPVTYKNLVLTHSSTYSITLPDCDLAIYGNLTVNGSGTGTAGTRNAGTSRAYTINGNLTINNSGILEFRNGVISTIRVFGNTSIAGGGSFRAATTGTIVNNVLELYGNLACAGTFDMNNTGRAYTYFKGTLNDTISGPGVFDFYNLFVDKGSDAYATLTLLSSITTGISTPFLTLSNGTFRVNNSALTLTVTSAGTDFSIPSTARLSVAAGTVQVAYNTGGGANNNDLLLAGKLEVLGGSLLVGNSADNTNNDIEYSPAGTPQIIVQGGQLDVNGQIRRSTTITSGSLNYSQSGGTVTVRGRNANAVRPLFEVLNTGSEFDMFGGTLIIANHINAAAPYDLAIAPSVSDVSGGTIQFGLSGVTPNNTLFTFKSSSELGSLALEATSNSQAIQEIYPLDLMGGLIIGGASSYYDANGLDLTIAGNMINNNTSTATGLNVGGFRTQVSTQTTSFLGSVNQTLTGTAGPNLTNFANLEVATAGGDTMFLSTVAPSNIVVNGDLTLTSGVFNDGGNTISLLSNADNNAVHYSPDSTSGGMAFIGSTNQGMTGDGSGVFGNVEINNGGHGIDMTDNSTINGKLKFTDGYLYIDNFALTLGPNSSIAGTTNAAKMIVLNGVSGDAGVTKIFPAGFTSSFGYPIGDNGKYTPCTYDFLSNANAAGATINVVPVDAVHPSIDTTLTTNYLDYYWKVVTTGFSAAYNITQSYQYLVTDTVGHPANIERYDPVTSQWSTVSGTVTPPPLSFTGNSFLDGSYTIGSGFTALLPDTSKASGNWSDGSTWMDGTVPNGNAVVIRAGDSVALSINGAIATSVVVSGVLDAKNTTFHNLGQVSGAGKIKLLPTGTGMFVFPGGSFDQFLSNPTSTVEYYGNSDGTMPLTPGGISKPYQNLIVSGTGIKYISSVDMKVAGNLTIGTGGRLNNTLYNRDIIILGNWIDQNTGTSGFTPGTGAVRFEGTSAQSIIMANNSMTETFYSLAVNNASDVSLSTGSADVAGQLILTLGNINTSAVDSLRITNTSTNAVTGGGVHSFVNGPLKKRMSNGSSFQFPVGDALSSGRDRYGYVTVSNTATTGVQTWTARFLDKDPTADGYNVDNLNDPLSSVISNEYWNIAGPAGGSANVVLSWDQYTGMSSSAPARALARVAEWGTPAGSKWNSAGQTVSDFGQDSGTVATSTTVSLDNHVFAIGAASAPSLITTVQSGLWNDPAVWGGRIPGQSDTVRIANPYTVTLNINTTITKFVVDNGSTFDDGARILTVTGHFVLNGTWSGSGTIRLTTASDTLYGSGSMTGTGVLEIAGSNKTIAPTASLNLKRVNILAGDTLYNAGTVTIDSLAGTDASSAFVNRPGSTLIINGPLPTAGTVDFATCQNTVVYSGSAGLNQTIKPTTYCHLVLSNSGIKTASGNFGTNGDLTINIGSNLTVGGAVTIQVRGALTTAGSLTNGGKILVSD